VADESEVLLSPERSPEGRRVMMTIPVTWCTVSS